MTLSASPIQDPNILIRTCRNLDEFAACVDLEAEVWGLEQRNIVLFQREEALARGIARMEWTFDPLEIKNCFLNIVKLGAIVRRYSQNLYGVSSSRLQGALPTDRLYAEWWLESSRTKCALDGKPFSSPQVERTILIPQSIGDWRHTPGERELALRVQDENRRQFEQAFAAGLVVFGFLIDGEGNGVFQLGRWQPPSHK